MTHLIRRMRVGDIDEVYSIEIKVHIAPWSREILRDCVLVGYDCRVIELTHESNPILAGYAIARYSENSLHILNICINQELQLQGYGRLLLEDIIHSFSKNPTLEFIFLEVRPSNTIALHLYASLGFVQSDIKKDYYKNNDGTNIEDAILLKKFLK